MIFFKIKVLKVLVIIFSISSWYSISSILQEPNFQSLIRKTPSVDCGPFAKKDRAYKVIDFLDSLDDLPSWLSWVKDALDYIATAIVIIPVIVVLM